MTRFEISGYLLPSLTLLATSHSRFRNPFSKS
ncbi:hypothetical protein FOQG_19591 [Fusarium oxysporum f. sp. raphani 54005]|uniref:Uncharacterized protein n=1 Tax=Fusarium oxysporum f. sp. raphani 54005 TaxID=1089458 RepID=X0BAX5_FUSOX|nr:hypothetical protein FOQG_19591 [Fusarium oxysporum f. sp. raphani 54005]